MLSAVIEIVKLLAARFTVRRQLGDEKRQKFASICDNISNVLERFIETREDRLRSITLCAELRQYVEQIRAVASGTPASDDINDLATKLDSVCDAWGNVASTAEPGNHSYEGYLDQLAEGVGQFRGLANVLRAK